MPSGCPCQSNRSTPLLDWKARKNKACLSKGAVLVALKDERVMMSMKAKLIGFSHSLDHWIKALVTLGEEILKLNRFKVSHGSSSPDILTIPTNPTLLNHVGQLDPSTRDSTSNIFWETPASPSPTLCKALRRIHSSLHASN